MMLKTNEQSQQIILFIKTIPHMNKAKEIHALITMCMDAGWLSNYQLNKFLNMI